jgi:hypothetical protein
VVNDRDLQQVWVQYHHLSFEKLNQRIWIDTACPKLNWWRLQHAVNQILKYTSSFI